MPQGPKNAQVPDGYRENWAARFSVSSDPVEGYVIIDPATLPVKPVGHVALHAADAAPSAE